MDPLSLSGHVPTAARERLITQGCCSLRPGELAEITGAPADAARRLQPFWDDLPLDPWLRDRGGYRRRRHGSFVVEGGAARPVPHRMHWQPTTYNALHGGLERWFDPLDPAFAAERGFLTWVGGLGRLFGEIRGVDTWFVEVHPFRIDTTGGVGRPTPEGAHRDGVDFVAVILMDRANIRGGESRVFEADGPRGLRFTLTEPGSALLLDDPRVIHETTPIQPDGPGGHRDTLVLTFRAGGFQEPPRP
jgi:hypothetical protein